jgi:hypothetical protein
MGLWPRAGSPTDTPGASRPHQTALLTSPRRVPSEGWPTLREDDNAGDRDEARLAWLRLRARQRRDYRSVVVFPLHGIAHRASALQPLRGA